MTVMENVRSCVELQVPYDLPVFGMTERFDARYAGRSYSSYLRDAEALVDTQLLAIERFGWDWAWLHVDDVMEFEPLGLETVFPEDAPPAVVERPVFNRRAVRNAPSLDPMRSGRLPVLLEAIAALRSARDDSTCITGRVSGPFTGVTTLFGMAETLGVLQEDPRLLSEALKLSEHVALDWGLAQIAAGAHAIWLNDSGASSRALEADQYRRYALEGCRRLVRAFQEAGALVFLYAREPSIEGLRLRATTGASALSLGPGLDISKARQALREVALIGNVEPLGLQRGSASQVAAETDRQVRLATGGSMILCTAESIAPDAKGPNLHTMIDSARKIWNLAHARA